MGAVAEQWTASELRPLRKHDWTVINHFLLDDHGDIDHLLIGPAGVVLVETKWSASGWCERWAKEKERDAIERLQERCDQVGRWLHQKGQVRGVLFEWGRGIDDEPADTYATKAGVTVVRGPCAARAWRTAAIASPPRLAPGDASRLAGLARKQVLARDGYDTGTRPTPPSLDRIIALTLGSFIAATLGILAIPESITLVGPWCAVPVGLVAVAAGAAGRKVRRWRLVADAWLAGVCGTAVLVLMAFAAG